MGDKKKKAEKSVKQLKKDRKRRFEEIAEDIYSTQGERRI